MNETNRTLRVLSLDGVQREFQLEVLHDFEAGREYWLYRVQDPASADFYEGRFCALGVDRVQSVMLDAHTLRGQGVSEALFEVVVADLRRTLVSSRKEGTGEEDEWRSADAEKMWKRFVAKGLAKYDQAEGRYVFVPRSLI